MDSKELREELGKVFPVNCIKWRVAASFGNAKYATIIAVPYVTSRAIQDRLDDVFGVFGWSDEYIETAGGFKCKLTAEWEGKTITKSDGAETIRNFEVKGTISDALKRAAVKFGIGRYLYDLKEFKIKGNVLTSYPNEEDYKKYDNIFAKKDGQDKYWVAWNYPELPVWATELSADRIDDFVSGIKSAENMEELKELFKEAYTACRINNLSSKAQMVTGVYNSMKLKITVREEQERQLAAAKAEQQMKESLKNIKEYGTSKANTQAMLNAAIKELEGYPELQDVLKLQVNSFIKNLKA